MRVPGLAGWLATAGPDDVPPVKAEGQFAMVLEHVTEVEERAGNSPISRAPRPGRSRFRS
ncbi:hypothetical protein HCN51_55030 [Nonomuraea sp. FMUSA5-5]|uniref:Uncharacterized protein n=1 Tax=Nonomuraea composti TaxID=2720023 RepID=A0ABX1BL20_9ACTN|nr:hypothetical protein [Nonomuraea sp. FMUSA5-5]NJP98445.1 hypothetical protein [Nonomuraea sp. FMUSA5-5]